MNNKQKIIGGFIMVMVVMAITAGIYWFSMPSEERNIIMFMMMPGESFDNYEEMQTMDRNDEALSPTSFEPFSSVSYENDNNVNVMAITGMVQNENSKMLKQGSVQTVGVDDYTGWNFLADEGADEGEYPFGPSPLSYYTTGIAANLHQQILLAARVKGVELDSVKVEVLNKFRWNNMMTTDGAGFLDLTTTNIIIESDVSEAMIEEIKEMAINAWAAGEALRYETAIEPFLVVNGDNWEDYRSIPGTSLSELSYDGDFLLTSVTKEPKLPEKVELESVGAEDAMSLESMSNLKFEIYAISESAGNTSRPYLKKVTISTPSGETWEIYSDEFMGENDTPLAPTSLEYFTAGTALCLTSQTTLVSAMMGLDDIEYRVENQMDYRQENINSAEMVSYTDTVHSYILIESDESQETLEEFFNKALSLCFAGEGLKSETEMITKVYLNGKEILN